MATGAGRQLAAQHSHSLEGWYAHIPGIRVLAPATLEDARGMLWTALEDPDPVLIFENVMLYNRAGELAENAGPVDIDRAAVRREGQDITLITYGGSLWKTLDAAEVLAKDGIEAEVIDLRTLRPLDMETIIASVAKTHRARDRRRGLEDRQPRRRDRHAAGRRCLLRPRRAARPRLQRRGADPLCARIWKRRPSRRCRASSRPRGGFAERAEPWASFACPRSAPTWRPERWSNG